MSCCLNSACNRKNSFQIECQSYLLIRSVLYFGQPYLKSWSQDLGVPILSVDYSLAPEAPFPRALEECFYAYCWALRHHHLLGTFYSVSSSLIFVNVLFLWCFCIFVLQQNLTFSLSFFFFVRVDWRKSMPCWRQCRRKLVLDNIDATGCLWRANARWHCGSLPSHPADCLRLTLPSANTYGSPAATQCTLQVSQRLRR